MFPRVAVSSLEGALKEMGITSLSVTLDPALPVYFPGQTVQAVVRIELDSITSINSKLINMCIREASFQMVRVSLHQREVDARSFLRKFEQIHPPLQTTLYPRAAAGPGCVTSSLVLP